MTWHCRILQPRPTQLHGSHPARTGNTLLLSHSESEDNDRRIFLTFDLAFSQTLCIDQLHITMSGAVHNLIGNIKGLWRDQDRIAVHTKKSFDRITPCFIFQFRYIFTRHAGFFIDALFFQFFVDLPDQLRLLLHMRIIRFVAVTVFNDLALFAAFQLHFFELAVQISPASHNAVTFFTDFRSQCIDGFLFLRIGRSTAVSLPSVSK